MRAGISIPIRTVSFIGFYLPTSSICQFLTGGMLFTFQTARASLMINEQGSKIKNSESAARHRFRIRNPESGIRNSEFSDVVDGYRGGRGEITIFTDHGSLIDIFGGQWLQVTFTDQCGNEQRSTNNKQLCGCSREELGGRR